MIYLCIHIELLTLMLTSTDDSSQNLPTTQIQPWSDDNAVAVEPINTTQPSSGMDTYV